MLLYYLLNKQSNAHEQSRTNDQSKANKQSKTYEQSRPAKPSKPKATTSPVKKSSPLRTRLELLELGQLAHYHRLRKVEKRLTKIQETLVDDGDDDEESELRNDEEVRPLKMIAQRSMLVGRKVTGICRENMKLKESNDGDGFASP